jgi:16S rRNA (guanine(1405)-N(7))-methyltransferase
MQSTAETLEILIREVSDSPKYVVIDPSLVRSIGLSELKKRTSLKEAVKSTRNKLHQVGSAFQEKSIPYETLVKELEILPTDLHSVAVTTFLNKSMQFHTSTLERTSIHETFFNQVLEDLGPIHSILDLACGLNPLNLPWMPVAADLDYFACDIYNDMVTFLNKFFLHFSIHGQAFLCDLTHNLPEQKVQLALLLKTIPCLEQIDKSAGERLLAEINAENILVTFPAHSLGGRSKGMVKNYSDHFEQLTTSQPWKITRFEFPGELAFLVRK